MGYERLCLFNNQGLLFTNALHHMWERSCHFQVRLDALRLLIACKRYQRAQGRWPGTLQELVPAFLPAVPTDPFDGQPFRYDPGREQLWSVGPDGKDDGGINTGNMDPDRVTAF